MGRGLFTVPALRFFGRKVEEVLVFLKSFIYTLLIDFKKYLIIKILQGGPHFPIRMKIKKLGRKGLL